MAERLARRLRRIGMRNVLLGLVLTVPLVLAGCGDDTTGGDASADTPPTTSTGGDSCRERSDGAQASVSADLDGDGTQEEISYVPPGQQCPGRASLVADVDGDTVRAELSGDLPVTAGDLSAVRIPDRDGDVVLVTAQHPRGGFQAHLFGYADDTLAELTVDGKPVFPFVATDTLSSPLAARCIDGGFEVTQARAHEPVGVVPAWDVDRTTYTVDGITVTAGATAEVADNVLDDQLRSQYRSLVQHALFEDCRSGS
jgi:hypothetical protein